MYVVILVTAANKQEADKIAKVLVEAKLAACVNVVDKIGSTFWWQGKIDKSNESLLIIKTKKSLFSKVAKKIKGLHSYTVPEIIALPIVAGNKQYLDWIDGSTN